MKVLLEARSLTRTAIAIEFKPQIFLQGMKYAHPNTLRLFCIPTQTPRTDGVHYGALYIKSH